MYVLRVLLQNMMCTFYLMYEFEYVEGPLLFSKMVGSTSSMLADYKL